MSCNPYLVTEPRAHGRLFLDQALSRQPVRAIIRYNYVCYDFPMGNEGLLIAPASSAKSTTSPTAHIPRNLTPHNPDTSLRIPIHHLPFPILDLLDPLFNRVRRNYPKDVNVTRLALAMYARNGLFLDVWVPPWVENDDVVGCGYVEALGRVSYMPRGDGNRSPLTDSPGLHRYQHNFHLIVLRDGPQRLLPILRVHRSRVYNI